MTPHAAKAAIRHIEASRGATRVSAPQELSEQTVEMVHASFARCRVAPAVIQTRAHAALHRLDDRLVLSLDTVEARARAGIALAGVPYEWEERHTRSV